MQDPAVVAFFEERKAAWLKKNLSASMSEEETKSKQQECEEVFALKNWLPNAAKRAGQISISTHPCTFSHPSARKNTNGYASAIIANPSPKADGFLRTGNVIVETDALGNAAALDVYKFLTITLEDGQSLLQHLEQDTQESKALLSLPNVGESEGYDALRKGFLEMAATDENVITSSKIKQVYFPITPQTETREYHQLSLLTSSGIVFEMRKRLDSMRFGDEVKTAREKRKAGEVYANHREIYGLTTIGYGGTKPQNISVLNNQNGGKAHLLLSVPPFLTKRDIHFPKSDFFAQSVNYFQCREQFFALHKIYKLPNTLPYKNHNNMDTKDDRDELYQSIVDYLIERMWEMRSVALAQYMASTNNLSSAQTTWLCEQTTELRLTTDDWLDEIMASMRTFIFYGYEKVLGKKAIKLGDGEKRLMQDIIEKNKELLR